MHMEYTSWLTKQLPWIQEAASRLINRRELSGDDIEALKRIIEHPKTVRIEPANRDVEEANAKAGNLVRLISLGPVEGIDALNPGYPLRFGDKNISVIFGANGTGKSGYTRILKGICGKLTGNSPRPNVFSTDNPPPRCRIVYRINETIEEVDWTETVGVIPGLVSVDIFDTETGSLYVEKQALVSYLPIELLIMQRLVMACKKLEESLAVERDSITQQLPALPPEYMETEFGKWFTSLSYRSEESELFQQLVWTAENGATIDDLNSRILTKDPTAEARSLRDAKLRLEQLKRQLSEGISAVSEENLQRIQGLSNAAAKARREATEASRALADADMLGDVGGETWRSLWNAAKKYSEEIAYKEAVYPNAEDESLCVLCQQPLKEDARERMRRFDEYVRSTVETAAQEAEAQLQQAIDALPVAPEGDVLDAMIGSAKAEHLYEDTKAIWRETERIIGEVKDGNFNVELRLDAGAPEALVAALGAHGDTLEGRAVSLDEDAKIDNRNELIKQKKELDAHKWVCEQVDAVKAEVARLKHVDAYNALIRETTGHKGISIAAGEMSATLITDSYVDRFNKELDALGASKISVELIKERTREGQPIHTIRLQSATDKKAQIEDVLSEGEHRVVSLAAFLADVTGSDDSRPFIFDDPISSLDQKYEERTVERLIALGESRQVIVFTHRLSLLGMLEEKAAADLDIVEIKREPWGTGHPSDLSFVRMTPNNGLQQLKDERLKQVQEALNDPESKTAYPVQKSWCSDFRILLEKIIEMEMLAGVVRRHRKEVQTQGKIHRLSVIKPEDCELLDRMMTKYSKFVHSQSLDTEVDLPEAEEMKEDITTMFDWYHNFKKRKP